METIVAEVVKLRTLRNADPNSHEFGYVWVPGWSLGCPSGGGFANRQ